MASSKAIVDKQYGSGASDYILNMKKKGMTLDDIKKNLQNWTFKSYTPYNEVTGKDVSQKTPNGTSSDLSYIKSTNYYGSWNKWDYNADISKDYNRAKEMAYNLKQDMVSNPKLFTNREDYNKYYNYDKRSDSQKRMLDEFFDNGNKYALSSTENLYADMASNASTDKNKAKLQKYADTYSKLLPELNAIRQKMDDRLWPVFDQLQALQTKYLQDNAYLRKLQMQYNKGMVEEANSRAAWQSASMWSMMSWQWLSQSAIASSMMWAEKTWVSELNNIQEQHIKTMKELSDAEADFTTNRAGIVNNLTSTEQNYLKDWYTSFKWLQDWYDNIYNTMMDEMYNPYETLTQSRVAGWAETLQSTGKADVKQSEYQDGDKNKRATILYNNLSSVLWNSPETLAKLTTYIDSAASKYSDFQSALTAVLQQAWAKPQVITKIVKEIVENPSTENPDNNSNNNNNNTPDYSNINFGLNVWTPGSINFWI